MIELAIVIAVGVVTVSWSVVRWLEKQVFPEHKPRHPVSWDKVSGKWVPAKKKEQGE